MHMNDNGLKATNLWFHGLFQPFPKTHYSKQIKHTPCTHHLNMSETTCLWNTYTPSRVGCSFNFLSVNQTPDHLNAAGNLNTHHFLLMYLCKPGGFIQMKAGRCTWQDLPAGSAALAESWPCTAPWCVSEAVWCSRFYPRRSHHCGTNRYNVLNCSTMV